MRLAFAFLLMQAALFAAEPAPKPAGTSIESHRASIEARTAQIAKLVAENATEVSELNQQLADLAKWAKQPPIVVEALSLLGKRGPQGPPGPAGPKGDPGRPPTADEIYAAVVKYFKDNPPTKPDPAGALYFLIVREDKPSTPEFTAYMSLPAWKALQDKGHSVNQMTLAEAMKIINFSSIPQLPCLITLKNDPATKTSTIVRQPIPLPPATDIPKLTEGIK